MTSRPAPAPVPTVGVPMSSTAVPLPRLMSDVTPEWLTAAM
jgi:hypothetical protein